MAADCTLQTGVQVSCNEAMLTGESLSAAKQPGDRLYMGCIVMTGRGEGVVTATGMENRDGKNRRDDGNRRRGAHPPCSSSSNSWDGSWPWPASPSVWPSASLGFLQGNDFLEMLLTGISLAVAAIPEGLPAIVTITLALSVNRILRRGAVIRKLHAVETPGCAGVICTDKNRHHHAEQNDGTAHLGARAHTERLGQRLQGAGRRGGKTAAPYRPRGTRHWEDCARPPPCAPPRTLPAPKTATT